MNSSHKVSSSSPFRPSSLGSQCFYFCLAHLFHSESRLFGWSQLEFLANRHTSYMFVRLELLGCFDNGAALVLGRQHTSQFAYRKALLLLEESGLCILMVRFGSDPSSKLLCEAVQMIHYKLIRWMLGLALALTSVGGWGLDLRSVLALE